MIGGRNDGSKDYRWNCLLIIMKKRLKNVQSILDHTKGCQFQLYIYDNCSTDDTVRILKITFQKLFLLKGRKILVLARAITRLLNIKSDYHTIINPDIF